MKKITLIALGLSIATAASAQQYEYGAPESPRRSINTSQVRFGFFVAPNISWMKPTANKSDDRQYLVSSEGSRGGFTWGLMVNYFFAENYGIETGFQLNNTGGKILAQENPAVTPSSLVNRVKYADFNYKLQFLELPFNLKLRSDDIGNGVRFFGQIGLSAGINISKKATYEVIYTDVTSAGTSIDKTVTGENEKLPGGLGIAPVLLAMNIGAGVEYPITHKMSLYGGLFFNNGFVPDATNPKEFNMDYKGKFTDANTRLNNFAFRIGLFF